MHLPTPTCVVRSHLPSDAASLARHGNNRKIWLNLRDRFPHPYTESDAAGYIAHLLALPVETSFAIAVDDVAVGGISLHLGHDIERIGAELGYWLGEEFWGRGIVTDAVRAVTRYGFRELELTRIFAVPFTRNAASCRVLEKAGYTREGTLRSSALKDGEIVDQYMYARLVSDRP